MHSLKQINLCLTRMMYSRRIFFTKNGNEFRSANGAPGVAYWQNSADYTLKANIDQQQICLVAAKQFITQTIALIHLHLYG